jgi:hypothetical protein
VWQEIEPWSVFLSFGLVADKNRHLQRPPHFWACLPGQQQAVLTEPQVPQQPVPKVATPAASQPEELELARAVRLAELQQSSSLHFLEAQTRSRHR